MNIEIQSVEEINALSDDYTIHNKVGIIKESCQTKEEKKCFHVLKLAQPCYLMRIRKSLYDLGLSLCWL